MIDIITGLLGNLLYPLFSIIFIILDTVQSLFMALAGIGGTIYVNGQGTGFYADKIVNNNTGNANDSGLIFYLLNTALVKNLLISITLLAAFLLIVFTVMAFIKNVYAAKQKTWQDIIASSLKGLISFIFVPVCCLLGVWVSNIVLQAINGATSTGGSIKMSRKLFIAAAYNANSYRLGTLDDNGDRAKSIYKSVYGTEMPEYESGGGLSENEYYATMVDQAYGEGDGDFCINIYVQWGVADGYSLWNINYLVLAIVGCFMIYVLVTLAYAMVRRMFILLMLFVISPALCAMYPLDDGSAVGQWKKNFISTTIGAYGAVAGMNLFLSFLPIIDQLGFTFASNKGASPLVDEIIRLFMMVAGLFIVKEMMQMISGYIGGDDAYSKGSGLRSSTKKAVKDYGKKTITGAFTYGKRAINAAKNATVEGGNFFANAGRSVLGFSGSIVKSAVSDLWSGSMPQEFFNAGKTGLKNAGDEISRNKKIKELEAAAQSYDSSTDKGGYIAEKLRRQAQELGILDVVDKKLAKKEGVSLEEYRSNLQLTNDYNRQEMKFDAASAEARSFNDLLQAMRTHTNGSTEFKEARRELKDKYGIDVRSMATDLGLSQKQVVEMIFGGVKVQNLDVNKLVNEEGMTREDAIKYASSGAKLNAAVDKKATYETKLEEAGEALKEAAEALKTGYVDSSKATSPTFSDTAVESIKQSIDSAVANMTSMSYAGPGQVALDKSVNKLVAASQASAEEMKKMANNTKLLTSELTKESNKANKKDSKP